MTETLDARGLKCPIPVLKARKAMKPLAAGDELTVLATDKGAPADFADFCDATGYELVDSREQDGEFTIVIRKT